jgi:CBS domain-containing protein
MKAHDVMTWGAITVEPDASVTRAVRLMLQNKVSGLPVVDAKGQLVGMVTEGDFLRRGELGTRRQRARWLEFLLGPGRLADEYVQSSGRKISQVMTPDPKTITLQTPLEEVVRLMEHHQIKRLPVVHDGKVVGVVSRADLLHALASVVREVKPVASDDATLREQIIAECAKQPWAPHINVVVRDGVVSLSGVITDDRARQAFIVAAENVPGVKAVRDQLAWIEPTSGMVFLSEEDEAKARAS